MADCRLPIAECRWLLSSEFGWSCLGSQLSNSIANTLATEAAIGNRQLAIGNHLTLFWLS